MRKFLFCYHGGHICLATSEVRDATRDLFLRRSRRQTIQTKLSFLILHAGALASHGTKIKLPVLLRRRWSLQIARSAFKFISDWHWWGLMLLAHLHTHLLIWFVMHRHFAVQHPPTDSQSLLLIRAKWRSLLFEQSVKTGPPGIGEWVYFILRLVGWRGVSTMRAVCLCACLWMCVYDRALR